MTEDTKSTKSTKTDAVPEDAKCVIIIKFFDGHSEIRITDPLLVTNGDLARAHMAMRKQLRTEQAQHVAEYDRQKKLVAGKEQQEAKEREQRREHSLEGRIQSLIKTEN